MEIRQLQYVLKLAEEKNFTRAAEKLHIAQPSLSQQIAKLEQELGVLLFQRSTNSVELTYAGEVLVEKAQKVIDLIEQIRTEMDDISQMRRGKLVIGSLPITGSHILPLVLPVYQERFPHIEMTLIEDTSDKLETLTASGNIDACILSLPIQDESLIYKTVVNEEIFLALPPQHPFAIKAIQEEKTAVDLIDLKNEPFVILKQGHGFRQITLEFCREAGFEPKIVFESSNIETVLSLVAVGMGVALTPYMVTRTKWNRPSPVYLPLSQHPTRTLVIAYRKGRYLSKAAESFINILLEVMKKRP